jgi:hypothetical protein
MKTLNLEQIKSAAGLAATPRKENLDGGKNTRRAAPAQVIEAWRITPEPWPDAVDGAQLLDTLRDTFSRFIVLPNSAAPTLALWIVHSYSYQLGRVAAYAALLSPEKRCGKSTALSVVAALAHRALPASNVVPAALYRVIERDGPTMLIDEVDSFVGDNEEVRGILNAGFTRETAFVLRCVGENYEPKAFNVFGPKLFAGIGKLPGTLADRSIIVPMRRKQPGDAVERFRGFDGEELRRKCVRWVKDNEAQLADADPSVPDALNDRAADLWRPLLAIADLVGGEWPAVARRAAVELSADAEDDSQTVKLLAACRAYFTQHPVDRALTKDLLAFLNAQEEEAWNTFNHGDGMNARQLANRLNAYSIASRTIRDGTERAKGYHAEDFADAFARYLPALPPAASVTA